MRAGKCRLCADCTELYAWKEGCAASRIVGTYGYCAEDRVPRGRQQAGWASGGAAATAGSEEGEEGRGEGYRPPERRREQAEEEEEEEEGGEEEAWQEESTEGDEGITEEEEQRCRRECCGAPRKAGSYGYCVGHRVPRDRQQGGAAAAAGWPDADMEDKGDTGHQREGACARKRKWWLDSTEHGQ